ncbi:hypothetical protein AX774_g2091 [Zancudomyces culisetae]|uniref:Uncharacterized protein n=1 Tax=Zancudomyces culisetae TaxID=1213189 RepID=A0A1R1PTQ7_ZANCU|nr:hypothetical protein AX774_g2091 [Zancudomyces culisetae]|eukprot:OMH84375.1 hypothetical protein AX774_g2091 [Zancudomyces culisetae]
MRIKEVKDKIDFKYEQIYNTEIPIAQVVTSTESIPPTSPNFPVSSSLALSAYTKDSNPSGSDGNNTKTGNQDIHMPSLNNENIITDHKGTGSVPEYLFSTHNSLLFSSPGCTNSSINPGNISTSSPITADEASIEPNVVGSETPVTLTSLNQTKLPLPLISKENDSELPDIEPLRIKTITPSTSLAGANGVASKNIPDTSNKNEHYPSPPLVSSVKIKTKRKPRVLKLD